MHLQRWKCAHAGNAARQVWLRIVAYRDHNRIVLQRFRCALTSGHNSTLYPHGVDAITAPLQTCFSARVTSLVLVQSHA